MEKLSFNEWLAGTLLSAAGIVLAVISYVHKVLYSRAEGESLEERVQRIETDYRSDLKDMRVKVDEIYKLVLDRFDRVERRDRERERERERNRP